MAGLAATLLAHVGYKPTQVQTIYTGRGFYEESASSLTSSG